MQEEKRPGTEGLQLALDEVKSIGFSKVRVVEWEKNKVCKGS